MDLVLPGEKKGTMAARALSKPDLQNLVRTFGRASPQPLYCEPPHTLAPWERVAEGRVREAPRSDNSSPVTAREPLFTGNLGDSAEGQSLTPALPGGEGELA